MEKSISAADANRKFSRILREVGKGDSYVVTSRGTPVARLVPVRRSATVESGRRRFLARLEAEPIRVLKGKKWTRDELHERGSDSE